MGQHVKKKKSERGRNGGSERERHAGNLGEEEWGVGGKSGMVKFWEGGWVGEGLGRREGGWSGGGASTRRPCAWKMK